MKKILLLICFIFLQANFVSASEIFGTISTSPNNIPPDVEYPEDDPVKIVETLTKENGKSSSGGIPPARLVQDTSAFNNEPTNIGKDEVVVLGISFYPSHSLLRALDKRIYLIEGDYKKYIATLAELKKYQGQEIIKVSDDELSQYQTRKYLNGDLIREIGKSKIYVLENGKKKHIISIDLLRKEYFGQTIFNISIEELSLYI